MSNQRKIHFTAGPAKIPSEVMQQVADELLDYKGLNMSVLEMSHRSKEFGAIIADTEAELRKLLSIPDEYAVLFMHGGARTQFSTVPMNLCQETGKSSLDYIIGGSWSKIASKDAAQYGIINSQLPKNGKFDRLIRKEDLVDYPDATYRFYCDNETIEGVEFNYVPESSGVTLVCDMTSNIVTRPIDISKFGIIFAGAQKNSGISGLTIVIVRKDLFGKHMKMLPILQNYQNIQDTKSLCNTPLTFAIYIAGLCYKWISARGGVEAMDKLCREKSKILYDAIDGSNGFYICPVEQDSRSRMNVVFLISDKSLDKQFLEKSEAAGLYDLKGHRSVGGFRASLYHGITVENVHRLVEFMEQFRTENESS